MIRLRKHLAARRQSGHENGLTLVELLVAFSALMVLFTIAATVLSTYVSTGTSVISNYTSTDELLPGSIVIQRLIRAEVEPAPAPPSNSACAVANASCPPFLTGSVGTYSNTFYANIGDPNGPAKIVMAESAPSQCAGCKFPTAIFTVTQYPATASTCPSQLTTTTTCSWSTSGKVLVDIPNVVNGDISGSAPLFTYNTLDPVSGAYVPNNGGTAGANGILPSFSTACSPPSSSSQNCLPDTIQSVGIDIQVQTPGSPIHENSFTVYRLSSSSYLYSPVVG